MGVELITVMPNPLGNSLARLQGVEWELETGCPSLHLFPVHCLGRVVFYHEMYAHIDQMLRNGDTQTEIQTYYQEHSRMAPGEDGPLTEAERRDLERRSWVWFRDVWEEDIIAYKLNTRFQLWFEFLPSLCYIHFLQKIDLEDPEFRARHLALSREVCKVLKVDEFLIAFDSATKSSAVNGEGLGEDFDHQKQWLYQNVGPPKSDLREMETEREDGYEIEGYYWERVE